MDFYTASKQSSAVVSCCHVGKGRRTPGTGAYTCIQRRGMALPPRMEPATTSEGDILLYPLLRRLTLSCALFVFSKYKKLKTQSKWQEATMLYATPQALAIVCHKHPPVLTSVPAPYLASGKKELSTWRLFRFFHEQGLPLLGSLY